MPVQPLYDHLDGVTASRPKMAYQPDKRKGKEPVRGRSRTNPDGLTVNSGPSTTHRGFKSVDYTHRGATANEMIESAGPARRTSKRSVRAEPDSIF